MAKDSKDSDGRSGIFGRIWERFGEVAKKLGLVGDADVQEALARQQGSVPRKRIGEILIEEGKLTASHVEKVLDNQKRLTPSPAGKKKTASKTSGKKAAPKKAAPKAAKKKATKAAAKKPKAKKKK